VTVAPPVVAPPPPAEAVPPPVRPQAIDGEGTAGRVAPARGRRLARPGYSRAPKRKRALMIAGLASMGAGYLGSVVTMLVYPSLYDSTLAIPFAGPWMSFGKVDSASLSNDERLVYKVGLVYQGVLQDVGLLLAIVGISQYIESGSSDEQAPPRNLSFQVVPTPGGAFGGLTGRF